MKKLFCLLALMSLVSCATGKSTNIENNLESSPIEREGERH